MIRYRKFGVERIVTDTSDPAKPNYKLKGLTDIIHYTALLVKPGMVNPQLILLQNGKELEERWITFYQKTVRQQLKDTVSYNQFWKKIGEKLGPVKSIYFSPDGVYHQINPNTLFNPNTKKYLVEKTDIRLVTSTKDLLLPRSEETENKLAHLIGHPNYYLKTEPSLMA
jgi:hypothetical protein